MDELYLEQLKEEVIKRIGRTLESPSDFDYLSFRIKEDTHEYVSSTTLKRVWGHIHSDIIHRKSTLSSLARYVGNKGWADYCDQTTQSSFISTKIIKSEILEKGERLEIEWEPNRRCVFEYLGVNQFIVTEAENSKLNIGDTFCAKQFLLGHSLYITDLKQIRNGSIVTDYVAGFKTGLTSIKIIR